MELEEYELEELKFRCKVAARAQMDLDEYLEQLEYWDKQKEEHSAKRRKNKSRNSKTKRTK